MATLPPVEAIGTFDGLYGQELHGWAWDPARPELPVTVDVFEGELLILTVTANRFRPDLKESGIGNGTHGFSIALPRDVHSKNWHLTFRCRELDRDLERSFNYARALLIDPDNFVVMRAGLNRWRTRLLLVDPISACNADCVYCPHPRSGERIDPEELRRFLEESHLEAEEIRLGCGHEPTSRFDLVRFLEVAASLTHRPRRLSIVTNGTLLHRHDVRRWAELGLDTLEVSIDSADPAIQRAQRPGADLETILRNVRWFRKEAPRVQLEILSVVTSLNSPRLDELVSLGAELGASRHRIREAILKDVPGPRQPDFPGSLPSILLADRQFAAIREGLLERFPGRTLHFLDRAQNLEWTPVRL